MVLVAGATTHLGAATMAYLLKTHQPTTGWCLQETKTKQDANGRHKTKVRANI
ncbi:hypothetical protein SAMN05443144_105163 [Fodinibius roseus]|uniref:NAD dependent epimerase/dehydratase family protein n=1 Tax=Fodinibius roseus TaxID=1194090 RepID=A0A1M4YVX6_9BACT|nr:hypothetical protein SAMN05443144_105163 [Fodinibius roseus]